MLPFSSSPSPHSVRPWRPVCCTTQPAVIRSSWHPTTRGIINTASTATNYASRTKTAEVSVVKVEVTARCVHALGGLLHRLLRMQSKTDPFRRGADVFLDHTYHDICPVSALLAYIVHRGQDRGPLFTNSDGFSLSRQKLVSEVHSALVTDGLDGNGFTGHSFRIDAATTAKAKGVSDSTVKTLGRWRSDAFQLYVRWPGPDLATVSSQWYHKRTVYTSRH